MLLLFRHSLSRLRKSIPFLGRLAVALLLFFVLYLTYERSRRNILPKNHSPFQSSAKPIDPQHLKAYHRLNPVVDGWGEDGQPVTLEGAEKEEADKQFSRAAFNVYVSDRLSPNRSLPEVRPDECSAVQYKPYRRLGQASIVIIYTNEIWSALVRTIWSVVARSPPELLREIILVDDFSSDESLGAPLDQYIADYFGGEDGLVRVIRLPKREGLIRARLIGKRVRNGMSQALFTISSSSSSFSGAKAARGDVIIFLDSHIEATVGWLEPLLATIAADRSAVVCPVIDIISDRTLEYIGGNRYYFQVGGFIWSGHFTWIDIEEERLRREPTKVVRSPTMAGGLFAINREYFYEIGAYDEEMEIWGGENLELSFRVWGCGGSLYIHPCSHVGQYFLGIVYIWFDLLISTFPFLFLFPPTRPHRRPHLPRLPPVLLPGEGLSRREHPPHGARLDGRLLPVLLHAPRRPSK